MSFHVMFGESERRKDGRKRQIKKAAHARQLSRLTTQQPPRPGLSLKTRGCESATTSQPTWTCGSPSALVPSYRRGTLHDNATVDDHTRELFLAVCVRPKLNEK